MDDGSFSPIKSHGQDIELADPGVGKLFALARAYPPQSGSLKHLTFQLLDGSEVVDKITYFGAALVTEAGAPVDHVFGVPQYMLFRERRLTVRTITDRGELPSAGISISFAPPF